VIGIGLRAGRARDVALAVVLAALLVLEALLADVDVPAALCIPVALAMSLPLVGRRTHPLAVATVALGAWVVQGLAGDWKLEPQFALLAVAVVFWSIGVFAAGRASLVGAGVGLAAVLVHEPGDFVVLGPLMAGVYAAGRLMRSREELARTLERTRAESERRAVQVERDRIARELHDVVGHSIALMTVQAGAERLALTDRHPETSEVLARIEDTGRETLAEMRRLLSVLHGPDESTKLAPQPGLGQVDALLQRVGQTGVDVELETLGEIMPLPPSMDISAYRIIQEALTNVLKHADARSARVRIEHAPEHVQIEVTDDGRARPGDAAGGHGLVGMRERAALYGGTLEAGADPAGGWRVRARLPRSEGS
jgi:signal transduction histidine kinase